MRITGWHIDSFGVFRDHSVRDIPPGLTVFIGPNEAGKTTLLAFIRQMLFGFPDEDGSERRYDPVRGGRLGGRLFLSGLDGSYTIERTAELQGQALVTLPDGGAGTDADLARLLGHCDRQLFQSVFAFSLTELQDFATLDTEGIHDRIFSAGITGAGRSARSTIALLRERQVTLLAPGAGARLDDLRQQLADVERRLEAARSEVARYREAVLAEEAQAAEIARVAAETEALRRAQTRLRLLTELWPLWLRRQTVEAERAQLRPVGTIPEQAEARLSEMVAALGALDRQLDELRGEVDAVETRRAAVVPDERLTPIADDLRQLAETLPLYRDRLAAVPSATAQRRRLQQAFADHLRDLGPDWTPERLAAFDRSLPQREAVRTFADALAAAEAAVARATTAVTLAESQQEQAEQTLIARRVELAEREPPRADANVVDLEGAVRRLRAAMAERATVEARLQMAEETLQQLATLQPQSEPTTGLSHAMRRKLILWGIALLLAALGVWQRESMISPPLAFAAVAVAASALIIGRVEDPDAGADSADPVQESVAAQQSRIQGDIEAYRLRLEELNALVQAAGEPLGLGPAVTAEEVEAAADRVAQLHQEQAERERLEQALRDAEQQAELAAVAVDRARATAAAAEEERQRQEAAWAAWKAEHGIPADLTPRGVLDFFDTIREAREAGRRAEAAERAVQQVGQFIVAYERRAAEVLGRVQLPVDQRGLALAATIESLRERIEHDREARRALRVVDEELARLRTRLAAAERERARLVEQRDALLGAVDAADEAEFRQRLEEHRRWQALTDQLREYDQQLAGQIGTGPAVETIRGELATGDLERWEREAEEAERQLLALAEARDRAIAARREAEVARRQLEASTAIPDLELERAGLLQVYAEAVAEWEVAAFAEGLISATLTRYERERQPAVLAHASRLFHDVTGGRYTGLLQQEESLIILDQDGRAVPLDRLSRGTAEQLYLCIRFGLATEFSQRVTPLPLVMDDVLVNFDPERARVIAQAIVTMAEQQQVLLFTCHPQTAALLRELAPTSGQYLMERYGGDIRPVPAELPAD